MDNPNYVDWLIPQRVLYLSLEGYADHSIFSAVNDEAIHFIAQGTAPIHVIADIQDLETIVISIRQIVRITGIRHQKIGHVIVVGAKGFTRFTTLAVRLITRARINMVNTLGEAYLLLWALDETLPRKMQ